jgi:hypothetical protein
MTTRTRSLAAALAAALAAPALAEEPAAAPAGPAFEVAGTVKGGLAYMQPIRFDYDQDGTRDRVQFFVYFDGRTASGAPGTPEYKPAEGVVKYVVYDHDKKKKVDKWLVGFNMGFPEPGTPYPMTNLVIEGNTAQFDAFDQHWTIVDGGKGYAKDQVVMDDHFTKPRVGRFYDGDVAVTPPR